MADRREELIKSLATEGVDVSEFTAVDSLSPAGKELRKQELLKSLADKGVAHDVPPQPDLTIDPHEQFQMDEDVFTLANDPSMAELDFDDLVDKRELLKRNEAVIKGEGSIDEFTYKDVVLDLKRFDKLAERFPVLGSVVKAGKMTHLLRSARVSQKKVGDNITVSTSFASPLGAGAGFRTRKVTQKDIDDSNKFIENWIIDLDKARNRTTGAKFTNALLEMPAFIIEFMLTGPVMKGGSIAAKQAATRLLGEFAEKGTGKLAVRAAGAAFGSLARTGVNVPKIVEGAAERMIGDVETTDVGAVVFADAERNPWTAITKSFTDLYIENLSEISGGAIGEAAGGTIKFAGKLAKKFPFINKVSEELAEAWIKNAPKGINRTLSMFKSKASTKIGFDGILGEFSEERLGDIMRAGTGLQEWEDVLISKEEALVEAGIFSVFGGVNLASEKIFRKNSPTKEPVTDLTDVSEQQFKDTMKQDFVPAEIKKESTSPAQAVTVATKSKAIDGNFKEATVTEPAGPLKRAIVRNVARAEDAAGTWGKTGKKIQKDLREISFRTAVNTGNSVQNIKPWTKGLSKTEKVTVAQLIDGAISSEGQPSRLVQRADAIRKELDVIQNEALKIGLRTNALSGKAFPQVLNKEGKKLLEDAENVGPKSSVVFAWAQNQVKEGKFESLEDAIISLQQYREGLISGKQGYVEGTRTLEIGNEFRDWNLDSVLSSTIESAWEKIEAGRQWGVIKTSKTDGGQMMLPFKDIQVDMAKLRADVGVNEANAMNQYLKAQYGLSGADTALVKIAGVARTTQFVGKLAFSPLTISRNIADRYAKGMAHGTLLTNARAGLKYPPFLNNWMKSARLIEDQMIRSGAVLGHGHLSEGFSSGEGVISLIAKPFASSERGNQTYIALVKKLQLESDVKRLMELDGREGKVSKAFDRMATIVGQSQKQTRNRVLTNLSHEQLADAMGQEGQIPDDVMAEVLHRTTTDSAFPLTLASKRLWWGSKPVMQTATQFKVWSADQTRFIYKDVIKYGTQTGDWSRLTRFMLGTWLMGEIYNISRDFMLNKDESVLSKAKGGTKEEIVMAIGKDLVDGGVVGFLSDFTYGIGDWAAGPTVSSISGFAKAIDQAQGTASLPDALGKFALQDIPALRQAQGVMDRVDREFFDEQNNLTKNYARWQGRSFDFRLKDGESSAKILKDRIMRSVRGVPTQKIGERSLSLNMIARQVLVGDFDDAADHIKRVIRQTEPKDLKGTIQALKQSKRNNSPFGNVSGEDLGRFIAQFSPEEAKEGIQLQNQWNKGYQKALDSAVSQLVSEGFEKEFNAKAEAYKAEMDAELKKTSKKLKEIEAEFVK